MHTLSFRRADFGETDQEHRLAVTERSGAAFATIYIVRPPVQNGHMLLWMLFTCLVSVGVREASELGKEGWLDYSCFSALYPLLEMKNHLSSCALLHLSFMFY